MNRDEHGILIQIKGYQLKKGEVIVQNGVTYKEGDSVNDGGDSAFSTGLNAFGGSEQDYQLMPLFIKDGKLVRHPFQTINTGTAPHNDPNATSADSVKGFFAGLHGRANEPSHAEVKKACLNYANGWRVNKDILTPANRVYLYKCADTKPPAWLLAMAYPIFSGEMVTNCFINPDHEQTQFSAMASIYGKSWIEFLYHNHPNLFKNLDDYFCEWRQRCEISVNMKAKILKDVGA